MDVACSTFCFSREPLDKALRLAAELDFTKVDLGVADAAAGTAVSVEQVAVEPQTVLQQIKRGPNMGFAGVTARLSATGDALAEQVGALAHFAKQLATATLTLDAGPATAAVDEEAARLAPLVKAAARHGVVLCVRTAVGSVAAKPAAAVALAKAVPGLGITLDPTGFLCSDGPPEAFDAVYPFVRHVHLRDSRVDGRRPQVSVGSGDVDFSRVVTALEAARFNGALVVALDDREPIAAPATAGPDAPTPDMAVEARKLGRVLESLL